MAGCSVSYKFLSSFHVWSRGTDRLSKAHHCRNTNVASNCPPTNFPMTTWTLDDIKANGFKGFIEITDLRRDNKIIPADRGVYLILKTDRPHKFLRSGTGGHFKKKNPNVDIGILNDNWVATIQ